jgi:hypothetical protein
MLREIERLLMPARDGSLLFGAWRVLGFAATDLIRSFLVRNIQLLCNFMVNRNK